MLKVYLNSHYYLFIFLQNEEVLLLFYILFCRVKSCNPIVAYLHLFIPLDILYIHVFLITKQHSIKFKLISLSP